MHVEKKRMFYFIGGLVVGAILGFFADMFLLRQRYSAEADALREQLNRGRDRLHELQRDVDRHAEANSSLQASLTAAQADGAHWQSQVEAQNANAQQLQEALATAEAELGAMKARLADLEAANAALQAETTDCAQARQRLAELEVELAEVRTTLAHETADPGEPDDLERIEGIGPKIETILNAAGIRTFRRLAQTPVDRLRDILQEAGLARLASPDTWAQQAELAAREDWEGLEAFQASLKGGRRA